jgi:hypothetical protein
MKANVDLLCNGVAEGAVAMQVLAAGPGGLDVGNKKPWFNPKDGKIYITVYKGGGPRFNSDGTPCKESYQNILVNANPMPLNINTTLRREEWQRLDEALLPISRTRLGGVQDLVDNGLVFDIGNGMGSTVLEYHDVSDAMTATVSMDGVTRGQGDQVDYDAKFLPLPIVHVDYEILTRQLNASRNLGQPLDTSNAEAAARTVNEQLETMLFTNTTYAPGGTNVGTIYSYVNEPSRNTVTLSVDWDASAKTAAGIIDDVLAMKQASINARHYGPWMLYIPTAYDTVMDEDYVTAAPQNTVRDRILKIDGITGVKVIDTLPANTVLLVQMTSDVVRLVRGMGIQNVQWSQEGGMITKYKVMTIQVPQVRADQAGNSGIVHLS